MKVCPICGGSFEGFPAISRKDNKTEICPVCGVAEMLEVAPFTEEQKAEIMQTARNNMATWKKEGQK